MKSIKKIYLYLIITFVVGFIFQGLYWYSQNTGYLLLSMWAPTIGLIGLERDGLEILKKLKNVSWKFLLLSPFLALVPYIVSQLIFYFSKNGIWNSEVFQLTTQHDAILKISNANLILGTDSQSFSYFALNLVVTILVGAVPTMFIATIGEEIGWRGYLHEFMKAKYGLVKGTFFVGLMWAYWHIPANLGGVNGSQSIFLTTFITFPLAVIFMSFVLGWLKNSSGAIWPCAFFHAVNNTVSNLYIVKPISKEYGEVIELLSSITLGLFFLLILRKKKI
jgi:membrane protease YdiL (CAAX protease family)